MKPIVLSACFLVALCFIVTSISAGTVTDIDGNVYQTVVIGAQEWMAENLKVTHYRNGDALPNVTAGNAWGALTTGAYCEYDNDVNNVATYGRLYNWYAMSDGRNIAPAGWHVPSDAEWKQLEMTLGMSQAQADSISWRGAPVGGKLKDAGVTHWRAPNTGATNESGFSALPGGDRAYVFGIYYDMGSYAQFWSSTELNSGNAWDRYLNYNFSYIYRYYHDKFSGFSVRCVSDIAVSVDDRDGVMHPNSFSLAQNYPNPFNPSTSIQFSLPRASNVTLEVFNILGQKVTTLVDKRLFAGSHNAVWNGMDASRRAVSTGIYLYRLTAGDFVETKKMILLK